MLNTRGTQANVVPSVLIAVGVKLTIAILPQVEGLSLLQVSAVECPDVAFWLCDEEPDRKFRGLSDLSPKCAKPEG